MRNILNRNEEHPFEEQVRARFGELKHNPNLRLQLFTTISGHVLCKTRLTGSHQFHAFWDTYEADDERLCEILDLNYAKISDSPQISDLKGAHSKAATTFLQQIAWQVTDQKSG